MAAAEVVTAPPSEKKGKKAGPKKAKSASAKGKSEPAHPSYLQMITEAILALKERNGSSQYAIAKYIESKYKGVLPANFKKLLSVQLRNLVKQNKLVKVKASYKLSEQLKRQVGPKKATALKSTKASKVPKSPKKAAPKKVKAVTPKKAKAGRKKTGKKATPKKATAKTPTKRGPPAAAPVAPLPAAPAAIPKKAVTPKKTARKTPKKALKPKVVSKSPAAKPARKAPKARKSPAKKAKKA